MRVLLDTTFALRGPSGTAVYLERLAAALRENLRRRKAQARKLAGPETNEDVNGVE